MDAIAAYLETARRLGERTADLHLALASSTDPAMAPEPYTSHYQRSVYQSLRSDAHRTFELLRRRLDLLSGEAQARARRLLEREAGADTVFRRLLGEPIAAGRIRCHGDYHLGQILWTGRDFVILNFEGDPTRALSERRIKRSPLRDVASMLHSFRLAATTSLLHHTATGEIPPDRIDALEDWTRFWVCWTSATFLRSYFARSGSTPYLPPDRTAAALLLDAFCADRALYALRGVLLREPSEGRPAIQCALELLPSVGS
jgi:maltose alpha-D-glucosyltransferase/alpha-amylase